MSPSSPNLAEQLEPPDDAIVVGLRAGSSNALAQLYDRYSSSVFGFCMSILRSRDAAEDATHEAFVKAAQRIHQLRDPSKLKSWLFSIARNEAIAETRRARRTTSEAVDVPSDIGPTPDERAESADLVRLVWDASEGLDERDREVLELTVRQGLNADEVAETLGLRTDHVHVLNHRLRKRTGVALGALMVARLGRRDCPELAAVLKNWSGTYSPSVRRLVLRHIENCDICEKRRAGLVSPLALMAAVPLAKPAAALRQRVLDSYEASRVETQESSPRPRPRPRWRVAVSAAAAVTAVVALVGVRALDTGSDATTARPNPSNASGADSTSARRVGEATGDVDHSSDSSSTASTVAPEARSPRANQRRSTTATSAPGESPTDSTIPVIPVAPGEPPAEPGPFDDSPVDVSSTPAADEGPEDTTGPPDSQDQPVATGPHLELSAAVVDLGHFESEGQFSFENVGDQPADWSAAGDGLEVTESNGTLDPGATQTIHVTIDRSSMPEGPFENRLDVASSGGNLAVDVVGTVRRSPEMGTARILHSTLYISSVCGPTQTRIDARVTDESDLTVEVRLRQNEAIVARATMDHPGGSLYTATVGPLPAISVFTVEIVATDSLNASASAVVGEIQVSACLTGSPSAAVPDVSPPLSDDHGG